MEEYSYDMKHERFQDDEEIQLKLRLSALRRAKEISKAKPAIERRKEKLRNEIAELEAN